MSNKFSKKSSEIKARCIRCSKEFLESNDDKDSKRIASCNKKSDKMHRVESHYYSICPDCLNRGNTSEERS